jgi:hypothetical protein
MIAKTEEQKAFIARLLEFGIDSVFAMPTGWDVEILGPKETDEDDK